MKKKSKLNAYLLDLVLCIYVLALITPQIRVRFNATITGLVCFAVWFAVSMISAPQYYRYIRPKILSSLLYAISTIIIPYFFGYSVIAHRYGSMLMIPFSYIIYDYYSYHHKTDRLVKIVFFMSGLSVFTLINTLVALNTNSYVVRSIKSSGEASKILLKQGVGDYSFIYYMVAMCIIFLFVFLENKKILYKLLALSFYMLSIWLIIKSNYMTALLSAVASSILLLILRTIYEKKRFRLIIIVIVTFIIIMVLSNLNAIIAAISDILPERISRVVVVDNQTSVFQSIWKEFIDDRWPTMKLSIDAFIDNFFFGLIGNQTLGFDGQYLDGLGQHSHILDTFALLGVGMGIWTVYIISLPFVDKKNRFSKATVPLNYAMMICIFNLFLFNNATASIACVSGLVMPVIREKYSDEYPCNLLKE